MFADGKPNPYMAVTPVPANGRPPIAVIIPTRDRAEIVCNAIRSLKRNLSYAGELRWWLGIDGSDDTPVLVRAEFPDVGLVEAPRRGLGANLNALIQAAQAAGASLFYQQDDDCYLLKPFDLTPYADKLMADAGAGWIRFMWNGCHNFTADLDGQYWRVRWDSREHYIASNRIHLKHRRFHEWFGLYPEGVKTGETEDGWCHQVSDIARARGGPQVLIPLECDSEHGWDHVGHSFQLQGL